MEQDKEQKPDVSVVVCTHNRYPKARSCLEAILNQKGAQFEVIVIDNTVEDRLNEQKKNFRRFCEEKGARYYASGQKGLCKARNLGTEKARGGIVAFTDDDCLVQDNWVEEIKRGLKEKDCLTGRTLSKASGLADLGKRKKTFSYNFLSYWPWRVGNGNNLAFKKEVLEKVGGFDERFGPGTKIKTAEDAELILRCLKKGYEFIYWPEAVVRHEDKSWEELLKVGFGYQRGYRKMLLKHVREDKDLLALAHLFLFAPSLLAGALVSLLSGRVKEARLRLEKLKGFLTLS